MTTEQKIAKAQELIAGGMAVGKACKRVGVSMNTYYKKRNVGDEIVRPSSAAHAEDWRDFAVARLIDAAGLPTTHKVGAIRELYSR